MYGVYHVLGKNKSNLTKTKTDIIKSKRAISKAKLKRITGSKYAWSLGKYPKRGKFRKVLDELKHS